MRLTRILAFAASLLTSCSASQLPSLPASDVGFNHTYAGAIALERDAETRLLELDHWVAKGLEGPSDNRKGSSPAAFPTDEERQLYIADVNMNHTLERLYTQAWGNEAGDGALRTALLHWTVLIRRALMRDFHTRVPGLEDDPDCAGDIVGDGMMMQYFEAVLAHRESEAALVLADLARQSACLGVSQSEQLATVLVDTFEELRAFLRLNGHEDLLPYVVQAASAPLLLFYDVEKYRGPEAPLSRWFRENRDILIDGVESGRQPSRWHGLWLYDRRSGRLFGFKATPKPVDENDVNLARFFASITTLENLGDFSCSFAEMVERGMGAHGYLCAGTSCGRNVSGRTLVESGRTPKRLIYELSGIEKTFGKAICGEGRDGPGEHGDGPKCGNDPGHNRGAAAVRCITEQVVHAGTEGFQCLGETGGTCGTPVASLVKDLQPQEQAGIKIGPDCALSSGMGEVKDFEWKEQRRLEKERRERQRLIVELEETLKDIAKEMAAQNALKTAAEDKAGQDKLDYEKAKAAAQAAGRDPDTDPAVAKAKARAEASAAHSNEVSQKANEELIAAQNTKARAEKLLKEKKEEEERKSAEEKKAAEKRAEEKKKEAEKKAKDGSKKRCVRDDPNCGDDLCTGMSQGARETMACVQAALSEKGTSTATLRPGVCDPRTCDPIEPNPGAAGTLACFNPMAKDTATVAAKHCWAMRCAQGQVPVAGSGACTCREGGGVQFSSTGGVNNFCTKMLCSEGTPTYRDGHCTCGGGSAGNPARTDLGAYGGLIPKKLAPVFDQPSTYSEVRYGLPH